jgi:hypothetical protein
MYKRAGFELATLVKRTPKNKNRRMPTSKRRPNRAGMR